MYVKRFHKKCRQDGECLIWEGTITSNNQCKFSIEGVNESARQVAYLIAYDTEADCEITTTCGNLYCVNVEHFKLASKTADERREAVLKLIKSHASGCALWNGPRDQTVAKGCACINDHMCKCEIVIKKILIYFDGKPRDPAKILDPKMKGRKCGYQFCMAEEHFTH